MGNTLVLPSCILERPRGWVTWDVSPGHRKVAEEGKSGGRMGRIGSAEVKVVAEGGMVRV